MIALRAEYDFALQLAAGAVDAKTGIIRGVTVAQAGVEATGKFILLDADGNLTRDPALAKRKLQVVTDAKTLETLLRAAGVAGGSTKSREDHDESIGARIGFADNFSLADGKVICDIHVFDNYRHRDLLLETAAKTPKEIGVSIDMTPSFEIHNGRALMRIEELIAVDVVDEGAITHDGLFLNRSVDNSPKVKSEEIKPTPSPAMAEDKKPEPSVADCMTAIGELAKSVASLAAKMNEKPADAAGEQLKATLGEINTKLAAQATAIAEVKQTAAALGQKPGAAAGANADAASETERQRLAAEQEKGKKGYLDLVEDEKKARKSDLDSGKLKAGDIHKIVMNANPEKYREHLKATGIYDQSRDPKNRAA